MGHNDLVNNIRKNLKFFGNPTLVSSRPKHDIVDAESDTAFRPTISSQAGFAAMNRPSTKVDRTVWRGIANGRSDQGASGDC